MSDLPIEPNGVQWPRDDGGHHESFYFKANAPDRKHAIWVRYVITAPRGDAGPPFGELFAIGFDGEQGRIAVAKRLVPPGGVEVEPPGAILRMGGATLRADRTDGEIPAADGLEAASWSMTHAADMPTIALYPAVFYGLPVPRKKTVSVQPRLRMGGSVQVGDLAFDLDGWVGFQGHNWGRNHAHSYCMVNGNQFEGGHDAFLEAASGRVHFGPLLGPPMGVAMLRLGRTTYPFHRKRELHQAGRYTFPDFTFTKTGPDGYRLRGSAWAPPSAFVGLAYFDPDGTPVDALCTKFGQGEVVLERKVRGHYEEVRRLRSERLELEFLLRDARHGVPVAGGNPFRELGI